MSTLRSSPKSGDAAAALKRAIQESAASDRSVGGAITLAELRPDNSSVWLENPPRPDGWKTTCDIIRDHRAGLAHIVAIAPQNRFDQFLLSSNCSDGRWRR
jgi:hypothetical protein